ncbi:hypothetical protein [Eubacterium sp. 1001713B170207_170306_E7]|uniref:hypothetical protein n=1 Tax=Eubacterium sp. 1001713B170207_170306_E7 TaxID=2787097 RepID=UPI00189AAC5A|nr:hypothetical protein [Eubacterium sp. 1001713B170207_170306_E7]
MKKFCCLLMAVLLFFTLTGCGPSEQSDPHTQKLSDAAEFQGAGGLDFTFDSLPENMGAAHYAVVDGAVAQVRFIRDSRTYIVRKAHYARSADISGVYTSFSDQAVFLQKADILTNTGTIDVYFTPVNKDTGEALACWVTPEGFAYSVYCPEDIEVKDLKALEGICQAVS